MMCCSGAILQDSQRVVAVVHARMGSARFPGKMLAQLGGHPVLEWVVRRTLRTRGIDSFVLATSDLSQDDALVALGETIGIPTFRGSHENVLQRVIDAADSINASAVVRVCADNPFIDSDLVTALVSDFRREPCDYLFNHRPGLGLDIADGFGAEIFDMKVLRSIEDEFNEPRYREHLTSAIWEHQHRYSVRSLPVSAELRKSHLRFDVDTDEDLRFLDNLVSNGKLTIMSTAAEILKSVRVH